MVEQLEIRKVRTDGGTQMRAGISPDTVSEYAEHIMDGAEFPAVVVFHDGDNYWLADGFHRVNAYKQAGLSVVPVDIRSGDRADAVKFALKANAANGMPRTRDDMRRGYEVICANELCDKADTKSVKELLGCSSRWAQELTRDARQEAKSHRDQKIASLSKEGKSQREIADEVGVDAATVNRSVAKKNTSEMQQKAETEPQPELESSADKGQPQSRGVGVRIAHEAIAVLKRIPLSDGLRQDAFDIVQDWIETNRGN